MLPACVPCNKSSLAELRTHALSQPAAGLLGVDTWPMLFEVVLFFRPFYPPPQVPRFSDRTAVVMGVTTCCCCCFCFGFRCCCYNCCYRVFRCVLVIVAAVFSRLLSLSLLLCCESNVVIFACAFAFVLYARGATGSPDVRRADERRAVLRF